MGYLGRRIGLSSETDSNPGGADGALVVVY